MDPSLLAAYDRPVPRYTSYPTAAQFTPAVGPAEHAAWLSELNTLGASLYLHTPFCRELCWYCACNTQAMNRSGTLDSYAEALVHELERVARVVPDLVLSGVQWGGGTPSQLGAARLRAVGQRIDTLFGRRSDAEVSLEIDPRQCEQEIVEALAAIGVTRISLGVQDFDLGVQAAINRHQSFEDTAAVLQRLRNVGIRGFNIDLVYGLPQQTLTTLAATLDLALKLEPDRFAVFGYAHVPWMKPHQRLIDAASLPGNALRAAMTELVVEKLTGAGYRRIGLDHYARPDDRLACAAVSRTVRRTFQGYVADHSPYVIGIGASAISSLPRGLTQNVTEPAPYMAMIADGFTTARGVAHTRDDRLRGDIIERIMCENAVDVDAVCRDHDVDPGTFLASVDLERLQNDGLVRCAGGMLTVTDIGKPFVRFVCAAFDRHYVGVEGRHSRGL
jgi:oxygen-independent coproporphyrinogen-3 oxidase